MKSWRIIYFILAAYLLTGAFCAYSDESWPQYKYDCRHSGNVPERSVTTPLDLIGAVPLTDAIFTAPVVAGGRIYVVDGSAPLPFASMLPHWPLSGGVKRAAARQTVTMYHRRPSQKVIFTSAQWLVPTMF